MQTIDEKELAKPSRASEVHGSTDATIGRTLVGVVERLELQVGKIIDQANTLLEVLSIPNEPSGPTVATEPTVTALDNRANRIEEVTEHLNRVQEQLEWATKEADKV